MLSSLGLIFFSGLFESLFFDAAFFFGVDDVYI